MCRRSRQCSSALCYGGACSARATLSIFITPILQQTPLTEIVLWLRALVSQYASDSPANRRSVVAALITKFSVSDWVQMSDGGRVEGQIRSDAAAQATDGGGSKVGSRKKYAQCVAFRSAKSRLYKFPRVLHLQSWQNRVSFCFQFPTQFILFGLLSHQSCLSSRNQLTPAYPVYRVPHSASGSSDTAIRVFPPKSTGNISLDLYTVSCWLVDAPSTPPFYGTPMAKPAYQQPYSFSVHPSRLLYLAPRLVHVLICFLSPNLVRLTLSCRRNSPHPIFIWKTPQIANLSTNKSRASHNKACFH